MKITCPVCKGRGKVPDPRVKESKDCLKITGRVHLVPCQACGGDGWISRPNEMSLDEKFENFLNWLSKNPNHQAALAELKILFKQYLAELIPEKDVHFRSWNQCRAEFLSRMEKI